MIELSMQQQLALRAFELQARKLSQEQAQDLLIAYHSQMMVREVMFKELLAHEWGLVDDAGRYSGPVNDAE